jgi:hypothetical protein
MIVKGMVELEKLKCALKRTRRSNKNLQRFNRNLKRSSEALKAKCRCTASKLSAATRAFDRHTSTIGSYEKCCSRWASELSDIVGEHRVEPLTTRELFEFARRSLSEFVKVGVHRRWEIATIAVFFLPDTLFRGGVECSISDGLAD